MIRCDKAMRRSKEKCLNAMLRPWRCPGECKNCFCALHKNEDGTWEHNTYSKMHTKKEK